jgi:hypothetical protein
VSVGQTVTDRENKTGIIVSAGNNLCQVEYPDGQVYGWIYWNLRPAAPPQPERSGQGAQQASRVRGLFIKGMDIEAERVNDVANLRLGTLAEHRQCLDRVAVPTIPRDVAG